MRFRLASLAILSAAGLAAAQPPLAPPKPPTKIAATPADALKPLPGFAVELVYSVPKDQQGSWVNLCVDPKGRLVASDQYGALYRVTPPAAGDKSPAKVEKLAVEIGMAQGLLYAFDALYVVVNDSKKSGLYRVTDTDGDDVPDKVELLRPFSGSGEHGPHAVMPHPDGKRLTVVCGNHTQLTPCDTSLVPRNWGDDHLLPRMPDGNGHAKGILAPGGYFVTVDPDGKNCELLSMGFRNQYDAAYNRSGDLFTYDSDMEWDYNTPWYRPTRVCHVTPGSDFGWRNGAGNYRDYYPDQSAATLNIGPGSPTGVCFGYGAKFPAKYQDAFFMCDWSYGKLYAVHLTPQGAGYSAKAEEFLTGTPLPLTDVVVNPADGAMYFAVGGRKTQSGLYRVRYTGTESTAASAAKIELTPEAAKRRELEAFLKANPKADPNPQAAVNAVWPHLGSPDRTLKTTARAVLEMTPVAAWRDKALAEREPATRLTAALALVRATASCPEHSQAAPKPEPEAAPAGGKRAADLTEMRANLRKQFQNHNSSRRLAPLAALDYNSLPANLQMDYLRTVAVAFHRLGRPEGAAREAWVAKFDALLPQGNRQTDAELLNLLVFLDAPSAATKGISLLKGALLQDDQLDYALALRALKTGWTLPLREDYFRWLSSAANLKGGNSLQGFIKLMKQDALATLTPEEKISLQPIIDAKPVAVAMGVNPARKLVKTWTVEELVPQVEVLLTPKSRDYARGRQLFAETSCFGCHRYTGEGGNTGPDLTGIAGRFGVRDLLESIILPSKEISDQYGSVEISTLDGKQVSGRIVNLNGDTLMVMTNGLDPNSIRNVNRSDIELMKPSKVSMMPAGLLDTLRPDEAADLVAYLLSQSNPRGRLFREAK